MDNILWEILELFCRHWHPQQIEANINWTQVHRPHISWSQKVNDADFLDLTANQSKNECPWAEQAPCNLLPHFAFRDAVPWELSGNSVLLSKFILLAWPQVECLTNKTKQNKTNKNKTKQKKPCIFLYHSLVSAGSLQSPWVSRPKFGSITAS